MAGSTVNRLGNSTEEGIKGPVSTAIVIQTTLFGLQTFSLNQRVLLTSQTDTTENGVYIVKPKIWERSPDFNRLDDVVNGQLIGAADTGVIYVINISGSTWLPGTTPVTFSVAIIGGGGFTQGEHSQLQTAQATTSGAIFEYTSIPTWVKAISLIFDECGTDSSTQSIIIEIGDSGGYELSGYASFATRIPQGTPSAFTSTISFIAITTNGTNTRGTGILRLERQDASDTWVLSGSTTSLAFVCDTGGSKSLSGTLDRLRIRTTGGAFNNGSFNVRFE